MDTTCLVMARVPDQYETELSSWFSYAFGFLMHKCMEIKMRLMSKLVWCPFQILYLSIFKLTMVLNPSCSIFKAKIDSPDLSVVKAVQKIAWSAGCGYLHLLHGSNEEVHKGYEKVHAVVDFCIFNFNFNLVLSASTS